MLKNKKILFIVNPVSGVKDNKLIEQTITPHLNNHKLDFDIIYTSKSGYAKHYVHTMDSGVYNSILILGGDGTINEILNGILSRVDGYIPILGFLPGGTGNAVLHNLKYLDPILALQPMLHKHTKFIDVMILKFPNAVEYSINILGWGLVSDIAILAEKLRFIGQSRYNLASLYGILKLKARECTLIIDNKKYHNQYLFILIQNTIYTGKAMKTAPQAKLDDGLIDILLVSKDANKLQMLILLSKLSNGSHIQSEYVEYMQVKNIELIPKINEAVNIDGDIKHMTPVKISVLEKKLPIYY